MQAKSFYSMPATASPSVSFIVSADFFLMYVDADGFCACPIFSAGTDYIVPTDAENFSDHFFSQSLISIDEIIDFFVDNREGDKPIVIILDCCRTEIKSRKPPIEETWAKAGARSNIAILYSTAQGEEALDSHARSDHSPFTELLLENIGKPGTIHDMDEAIRRGFQESSRLREQQVSSTLRLGFGRRISLSHCNCFNPDDLDVS